MAITPPPRPGGWSLDNMQSRHGAAQSGGIWGVNRTTQCQIQNQMITLTNTKILRENRLNQQREHGVSLSGKFVVAHETPQKSIDHSKELGHRMPLNMMW